MKKMKTEKSNILIEKKSLTGLVRYLNEKFKKQSGKQFTTGDVQQYVTRGSLPKYLGKISVVTDKSVSDVKLYNLVKNE